MATILLMLRNHGIGAIARAMPSRIFVARCEEDYPPDINRRAVILKLLMSQFLTPMSVCNTAVCATYNANMIGDGQQ
jgi:hypothetical protein